MEKKMRQFYIDVLNCNYGKNKCPQASKSFCNGWVPRGFSPQNIANPKILVVGKNPGHPLNGETKYYKNKKGKALMTARKEWSKEWKNRLKNTRDMSLKYQHNLRRYLRYFLGLTEKLETYDEYKQVYSIQFEKEIEKAVSITNLFKCSTECEQEKIKGSSFDVCYDKFFVRELDLIQPQIILALGDEVTKYLKRKKLRLPLFSIKHPSYFYKKADESDILCSIKKSGSPGRFKVIHFF